VKIAILRFSLVGVLRSTSAFDVEKKDVHLSNSWRRIEVRTPKNKEEESYLGPKLSLPDRKIHL